MTLTRRYRQVRICNFFESQVRYAMYVELAREILIGDQVKRQAGFTLVEQVADGSWPGSRFLGPFRGPVDRAALAAAPGLFGWQFVLTGRAD